VKRVAPAAARNRDAIADVLARWLPASGCVLEVASGTGEHVVHFARRFASLIWQASDADSGARDSIAAWIEEALLPNLLPPLCLDALAADWPLAHADAVLCINMVHISPWEATLGLIAGAAQVLPTGGPLILYGPYRQAGLVTAASNEDFDASLKARDGAWGLRSVEDVAVAARNGFSLDDIAPMPANNLMLLFRRKSEPAA